MKALYECKTDVFRFLQSGTRGLSPPVKIFKRLAVKSVCRALQFEGNMMKSDGLLGIDRYQYLERVE